MEPHAADEAGGEIVFSSDGLEPIPVVRPPTRIRLDEHDEDRDEDDDDNNKIGVDSDPSTAWESSLFLLSPIQRLQRMKEELAVIQRAMKEEESATSTVANDEDDDNISSSSKESLRTTLQQLEREWQQTIQSYLPTRQEHLQHTMDGAVQGLLSSDTTTTTLPQEANEGNEGMSSSSLMRQWHQRLLHLEAILGSGGGPAIVTAGTTVATAATNTTTTSSTTSSLLERLGQLEQNFAALNDQQADLWQRRAKTIRQDLEAAAKARNKLGGGTAQQNETITHLYNQYIQLQGLSDQLPVLVTRLQNLAHLHTHAATVQQRLAATERTLNLLREQVQGNEEACQELQKTLLDNANRMVENMKVLDERIAALQGKE